MKRHSKLANFSLMIARDPRIASTPSLCTGELRAIRKQKYFICSLFYGRACRWAMLGESKPKGPSDQNLRDIRSSATICTLSNLLCGQRPTSQAPHINNNRSTIFSDFKVRTTLIETYHFSYKEGNWIGVHLDRNPTHVAQFDF